MPASPAAVNSRASLARLVADTPGHRVVRAGPPCLRGSWLPRGFFRPPPSRPSPAGASSSRRQAGQGAAASSSQLADAGSTLGGVRRVAARSDVHSVVSLPRSGTSKAAWPARPGRRRRPAPAGRMPRRHMRPCETRATQRSWSDGRHPGRLAHRSQRQRGHRWTASAAGPGRRPRAVEEQLGRGPRGPGRVPAPIGCRARSWTVAASPGRPAAAALTLAHVGVAAGRPRRWASASARATVPGAWPVRPGRPGRRAGRPAASSRPEPSPGVEPGVAGSRSPARPRAALHRMASETEVPISRCR